MDETVGDLDLPFYVFVVVVLSRAVYSGIVTLGFVWIVAPFVGLPSLPSISLGLLPLVGWIGLFLITAVVVIGLGFRVWIILSWLTASVFSAELRGAVLEAYREKQAEKEQE